MVEVVNDEDNCLNDEKHKDRVKNSHVKEIVKLSNSLVFSGSSMFLLRSQSVKVFRSSPLLCHRMDEFHYEEKEDEYELKQKNESERDGEVVVNVLFVEPSKFRVKPIVSEIRIRLVISPGRITEDILVPSDHIFEIVMKEIEEVIRPKGVIKKPESKELSYQERL